MCGRFTNKYSWRELHDLYRLTVTNNAPNLPARYNIAPTQRVPVIRATDQGRELAQLRWGLIPFWAKDEKIGYSTINARAETVATKPAFREAYRRRRCIIPASGFYEWKPRPEGHKQPFHFRRPDGAPLSFAGLWERWKGAETIESFTIIVNSADDFMREYHDRAPVILSDDAVGRWLDPDTPMDEVGAVLRVPAPELVADPVSTRVNSVRNEGEDLVERVEG